MEKRQMVGRTVKGTEAIVYVVHDQAQAARSMAELVSGPDRQVRLFDSVAQFLESVDHARPGCVVVDLESPPFCIQDLRRELVCRGLPLALVLITTAGMSLPTIRFLREGEVRVLDKPYTAEQLTNYVEESLAQSEVDCRRKRHHRSLEDRFKQLTPQDREVLHLMLQGQKNRTIAKRLEVSLRTVENRRRRCFDVMGAGSLAEMTRMVVEFEYNLLPSADSQQRWLSLPHARVAG